MSQPAPWTRLYNNMKIAIPAVTEAVLKQEIFRVAVDFTQDTNLWTEDVDITFEPNVHNYEFEVDGGSPYRLMVIYDPADPRKRWKAGGFSMAVPGIINCVYPPTQASAWKATIAKAVSDPATSDSFPTLDAWIVEKYNDVLYYGVLAYVMAQPKKSYSDPKEAARNLAGYLAGKAKARVEGIRMNTYGSQSWSYPQGWSTHSGKGWV